MNDVERMIGAFKEFKEWQTEDHREIKVTLKEIEVKLDALRLWKASVVGMSAIVSIIAGYLTSIFSR